MLAEGDRAPDARLELPDGKSISIADFKGQKLILFFCPGDEPSSWVREMQDFATLAEEFEHCGAWIIGLPGYSSKVRRMTMFEHLPKVSFATDPDGSAYAAFEVSMTKGQNSATFLLDRDGTIERIWRGIKISGHAQEVLEAARELP